MKRTTATARRSLPAVTLVVVMITTQLLLLLGHVASSFSTPLKEGDILHRLRSQGQGRMPQETPLTFSTSDLIGTFSAEKVLPQVGMKEKDKIVRLPGQPDVDFDQYGGYVTVDQTSGRALFYYFVEAPRSSADSKSLLLWLNGGPGCSSLAYGAMEELGPFRVHSDGKTLYQNPYAWNKVANVLFLESPAGTGFSYTNTSSDMDMSGDTRAAEDAYVFLANWFERFPEYKGREFYVAGESYAGHYVPQLAHTIHHYNQLPINNDNPINLRGIIIGNGVLDHKSDEKGMIDFVWTHAFISDENMEEVNENCDFSDDAEFSDDCSRALGAYTKFMYQSLDIYNVYGPLCFSSNITASPKRQSIYHFDPCSDQYVAHYMNLPEVQDALHANTTKGVPGPWTLCSRLPWHDSAKTVLPLLQELLASGVRVWIFSGDIDGRVPVTSTKYAINKLNLPVVIPWKYWIAQGEVGGYSIVYKGGLTFATVRGAGHMVPSIQPLRALVLIKNFLVGMQLPSY